MCLMVVSDLDLIGIGRRPEETAMTNSERSWDLKRPRRMHGEVSLVGVSVRLVTLANGGGVEKVA